MSSQPSQGDSPPIPQVPIRPGAGQGNRRKIEKASNPRQALARLLPYLGPHRLGLVLVAVLVVLYTLLGLLGPYLMGLAIDRFIGSRDPAGLARIALLMLATYVFANLCHAAANWIMARISQQALKALRTRLFGQLQVLPLRFFDHNPAGDLMSRLTNDIEAINQAISQNVTALIASVLSLVGILVAMFLLNPWLALTSLVVVPLMIGFTQFIARYTRRSYRELQHNLGSQNSLMEEAISGQKVIQAFRRGDTVMEKFKAENAAVYRAGVAANTYALLLIPLTNVLGNFFVILLAGFGGWLALQNLVTVGTIATFIHYGQNFIQPMRQLANMYNAIQAALAGSERVFQIIDETPEPLYPDDPLPLDQVAGDVSFHSVNFGYLPGQPVIREMSLEVQAGQTIALVGPTGAGKTTIINLLNRFYEIESGAIEIDGKDIRRVSLPALRSKLGMVLQDTFLFSDTVMENIRYGRLDASDEECIRAAELADADHFIRQLPQGYQTLLSERAGNLSQGQRQLLAIARAILADPAILILDEATSSVDTRTEVRIQAALLRLMEGRTSFVIAHRLSTIRDADLVVVINQGEIVEQGSHDELLAHGGFYHNLYWSQFKGKAI